MTSTATTKYTPGNPRVLAMTGIALILAGIVFHEWTLVHFLKPAAPFRMSARFHWWYFSLNAWALGLWLILWRRKIQTVAAVGMLLLCAMLGLILVGLDLWRGYVALTIDQDARIVVGDYQVRDADLGWTLKPGGQARVSRTGLYDVIYTIDDEGFRRTIPSSTQPRQVFVLGDSFAFGWGVNDDDTLCSRLAAILVDRAKVLNLAVEGHGVTQIYGRFQQFAGRIREGDAVILTLIGDDIARNWDDFLFVSRMLFFPRPLQSFPVYEAGRLRTQVTGTRADRVKAVLVSAPWMSTLFGPLLLPHPDRAFEDAAEMVDRIRATTESRGARFLVVQLPTGAELRQQRPTPELSRLGAVQAKERFPKDRESLDALFLAEDDGHYSPSGNRLAGTILYDALSATRWPESKGAQ